MNEAAPLVAVFGGWGFMLMVSADLSFVNFGLLAGWPTVVTFDFLNLTMNKAAPLVAVFDEWGFMRMVSADLSYVDFGLLDLVHQNRAPRIGSGENCSMPTVAVIPD
jgi:hypothetical protein